jgi:hypothetical protein
MIAGVKKSPRISRQKTKRSKGPNIMVAPPVEKMDSGADSRIKDQIHDEMTDRLAKYENANPHDITYRLVELDREWDVERILQFGFSGITLGGITLSKLANKKWIVFPCLAAGFLMQQLIAGWCPPFLVLRRLGFRTAAEINRERMALKIMRGDFAHLGVPSGQAGLATQGSMVDAIAE